MGDFPRNSNIRTFESGPLGTHWRHWPHWKNDEDHAASIVDGGPLMWPVIVNHALLCRHIV